MLHVSSLAHLSRWLISKAKFNIIICYVTKKGETASRIEYKVKVNGIGSVQLDCLIYIILAIKK